MWCSDPVLSYLKEYGYNPIRLPKADVHPLQILAEQGRDLVRLGEITTLLVTGGTIPIPAITANIPAATVSGKRTDDMRVGVGLSILGGVIGAMGGSTLGLGTTYKDAKTVAFEFMDVLEDRIAVADADQYLADADVSPFSRHTAELLDADELYLTTATIKSTKFAVEAKTSRGAELELSVPVVQGAVGGNVKVSGQAETSSKLIYEGSVPLVFGFQAVRLFYSQGQYTAFEPVEPGEYIMRRGEDAMATSEWIEKPKTQPFVSPSPFARLGG